MKSVSKWMGRTVFVLAIGLAGPAWADAPVDEAAASALYEKGIALENAGEWAKAEVQFQESLKHHARPRAAAHLGRVQVEQGKFVEGATNMEWFFQEDTEIPLEAKKGARQPLDVAMKNVGILKLSIEPLDAKVFIDGQEIETRRTGWPQYVTPGVAHKVEVKKDGFVTKSEAWTVAAGTEKLVKVTLETAKVEAGDGKGKEVAIPGQSRSLNPWWIGGGVAGLAFLGTGIGATITYSLAATGVEAHKKWKDSGLCDSQCMSDFSQYENYSSKAQGLAAATIATGVMSAGIFMYIGLTRQPIFLAKRSKERGEVEVMPGIQGLTIRGKF